MAWAVVRNADGMVDHIRVMTMQRDYLLNTWRLPDGRVITDEEWSETVVDPYVDQPLWEEADIAAKHGICEVCEELTDSPDDLTCQACLDAPGDFT